VHPLGIEGGLDRLRKNAADARGDVALDDGQPRHARDGGAELFHGDGVEEPDLEQANPQPCLAELIHGYRAVPHMLPKQTSSRSASSAR